MFRVSGKQSGRMQWRPQCAVQFDMYHLNLMLVPSYVVDFIATGDGVSELQYCFNLYLLNNARVVNELCPASIASISCIYCMLICLL